VKICAVVLTFNRGALLVECLHALLAQSHALDHVLVVDNASTDGTEARLGDEGLLDRVEYLRLERNVGSSGGFHRGVAEARGGDWDWVWIMDDDAEPCRDALERLLAAPVAADARTAVLAPAVLDPDGRIEARVQRGYFRGRLRPLPREAYIPGHAPEVDYVSFVGMLVRGGCLRVTEPPKAEFFIWGDDVEYCLRLQRCGAIRVVPDAAIIHKEVGQSYSNRRARFWNRVLRQEIAPLPFDGFWKQLFGLRNFVWIKKTYAGQGRLSAAGTIAQFAAKSLMYEDRPLRRLPWIVRFGIDGRRGRFENVEPREWAHRSRRGTA
jgi:rhamnopyranosyl-N-acetylglucosaminyl-diphospho-decaprenol beta-1,3/1,4-galactofuranosyltransferase